MVTIIKKGANSSVIKEALKKINGRKGFDAKKHCGVLHLDTDALEIQKALRNEWE
jgi:hypothetical protein